MEKQELKNNILKDTTLPSCNEGRSKKVVKICKSQVKYIKIQKKYLESKYSKRVSRYNSPTGVLIDLWSIN